MDGRTYSPEAQNQLSLEDQMRLQVPLQAPSNREKDQMNAK